MRVLVAISQLNHMHFKHVGLYTCIRQATETSLAAVYLHEYNAGHVCLLYLEEDMAWAGF